MKDFILDPPPEVIEEEDKEIKPKRAYPLVISLLFPLGMVFLLALSFYHLPPYFSAPPHTLIIRGNDSLDNKTILTYLDMKKGLSWFDLDPFQLSVNLKKHPWIDSAVVHRSFPSTLTVSIVEREPVAYLRTEDDMILLGKDGMVLKNVPIERNWNLPIIVNRRLSGLKDGDLVQRSQLGKAFQLIEILKDHPVIDLSYVSEIIITDPYNIEIITIPHGIRVKFGFNEFEKKLAILYRVVPSLYNIQDNINYIDLRYVRGVVVKKNR